MGRGFIRRAFLAVAVLLLLSKVFATVRASEPAGEVEAFRAGGTITYQGFDAAGSQVASQELHYSATVIGSRWIINLALRSNADSNSDRTTVSCDGTNVYAVFVRHRSNATNYVAGTGTVRQGILPYPDETSLAAPVWLALAAGNYIDSYVPQSLKPVWFTPFYTIWEDGRSECAYQVARSAVTPRVVTRLVFKNRGMFLAADAAGSHVKEYHYPPPFDRGFTNAVYEVDKFDEWGVLRLPRQFHLDVFKPSQGGDAPRLIRYLRFSGTVESASVLPTPVRITIPPLTTTRSFIDDYRVTVGKDADGGIIPLTYVREGSWLVSTNSTQFRQIVADNVKLARRKKLRQRSFSAVEVVAQIALLLAVCSPVVVYAVRRRKGPQAGK